MATRKHFWDPQKANPKPEEQKPAEVEEAKLLKRLENLASEMAGLVSIKPKKEK